MPLPITTRDILRNYARGVRRGEFDNDLDQPTRNYLEVMLNVASNDYAATADYPPSPQQRDIIVSHMIDVLQYAVFFFTNSQRSRFGVAIERAVRTLRAV